ncbi:MAG: hypothetical protein U9P90_04870 [Patescibacteria group bacterium]|nr:hypothetical protein [Patescibacteria group bacterium]
MPAKFILKSYQLSEDKKWIPAADLFEYDDNSLSGRLTNELQVRNQEFETKEEANKFISDILTKRGHAKKLKFSQR